MASGKSVSDTLRAVFLQSYGTLNGPVTEKDAERLNSFPLRKHLAGHPEYLYLLFVPVYLLCFTLVERLVPPEGGYWVSWTPLDDRIPFFESFVVPYCAWYPLLFGVGLELLRSDVPGFKSYMHFLMLGFGFSLLFCLAFPNGQDLRPERFARENLFTAVLRGIYAVDTNTNVFPSMHVVGCGAVLGSAFRAKGKLRRFRWAVLALCALICASTVLVKQHSVLDLVAGIAVCAPIDLYLYEKAGKKRLSPGLYDP